MSTPSSIVGEQKSAGSSPCSNLSSRLFPGVCGYLARVFRSNHATQMACIVAVEVGKVVIGLPHPRNVASEVWGSTPHRVWRRRIAVSWGPTASPQPIRERP